ncbi:MAG: M14 family zinc carboxypeptidase [Planctomycetota bacterium]
MILVTTSLLACAMFAQEPPAAPEQERVAPERPTILHALPPIGYRTPEEISKILKRRAKKTKGMSVEKIGETTEGRPLWITTFDGPQLGDAPLPGAPEVLVVANLEGDRLAASEVAISMVERFSAVGSPLFDRATLHVLCVANPDAMAHVLAGGSAWRGKATDNDRDGLFDEDGPSDINGDGRISWMRVPEAGGPMLADPEDERSSRAPDPEKSEAGTFRLLREGSDADGDRLENEDGRGGVAVEANFPHRWIQYAPNAGDFQLSEVESRALAEFVLSHPAIQLVLVLDDEDNLASPPGGKEKVDTTSEEPLKEDARLLKIFGDRFYAEDVVIKSTDHQSGNFADWMYFQRGALVLESSLWSPPLDLGQAEAEDGEAEDEEGLPKDASEDRKLLAWADHWYRGDAFQPWEKFEHPSFGEVEIGGWMPLVRTTPPPDLLTDLTTNTADFLDSLAEDFAQLVWENVEVTALDGKEVFEVRATLVNHGLLPTMTAMGETNHRPMPLRISLTLPQGGQLLVGRSQSSIESLDGLGGHKELHWIYRLPAGSEPARLSAVSTGSGEVHQMLEIH